MTDLYQHFSQLLNKSAHERTLYIDTHLHDADERSMLEQLLKHCEHRPGDTLLLAQMHTQQSAANDIDITQLQGLSIGPYRLSRRIGQGGMGVVYLAHRDDDRFEQRVAFKFLYPSVACIAGASWQQEAQLLSKIKHPVITQVLDAGITDTGLHYIMMEYVEGQTFDVFIQRQQLSLTEKIRLILPLVDAICTAHALNIVHGDLKPANILVTSQRQIKLLDFGIAKQVKQEPMLGARMYLHALNLPFAAPEQLDSEPATLASDQYALGALLYLCITGRQPFTDGTAEFWQMLPLKKQPLAAITVENVRCFERLKIRHQLAAVVHKTMAVQPTERYQSMLEVRNELQNFISYHPLQHQSAWYWHSSTWMIRHRFITMIAGILMVTSAGLLLQNQQIRQERHHAQQIAQHLAQLFQATDPFQREPSISAVELLHRGANNISQDLTLSLEVRQQLLQVIAQAYFNLGDYTNAEQLIRQLLRQQIATGKVTAATVQFYATISEYFTTPPTPTLAELAALNDYFTTLTPTELLTPANASALLSLLSSLKGSSFELESYAELEPYMPQLVAMFPDNRWKMAALLQTEFLWYEQLAQLRAGEITEQQWLELNKTNLTSLMQTIDKTPALHPNYVDLIEVALNSARIAHVDKAQPAFMQRLYQQLENSLQQRLQKLGPSHGSVIEALNSAILAAEYLDDWALMERNIQRAAAHIRAMPNMTAQQSRLLRHQAALYFRQGRREELTVLTQQWLEQMKQTPALLASYNFDDLSVLADALTAMEEKEMLALLLPWVDKALQQTPMEQQTSEFFRQQFALRKHWLQTDSGDPHQSVNTNTLTEAYPKSGNQRLYIEAALLSGNTALVQSELTESLQNIELTLKFCPPSYCDNNLLVTALPLKLAALEFSQHHDTKGFQLLELVKHYAKRSNNTPSNIWLQQAAALQNKYQKN